MKTEDENAPTCTPYLPDDFVFDMSAELCQAVGMKKKKVKQPAPQPELRLRAVKAMERQARAIENTRRDVRISLF